MQWFYDLKTFHKMCVLIAMMAIGIISVGVTGYYFNSQANNSLEIMYNKNLKPIRWINIFRINLNANRTNELALIMDDSKNQQDYIQDIQKRSDENNKYLADFKAEMESLNNDEALAIIANLEKDLLKYRQGRDESIRYAQNNNSAKAFQTFKENTALTKQIFDAVGDLATNISDRAENRYQTNQKDGVLATTLILVVSISVLIFCTWLGFLTANRIAGILGKLGEKMNAVAKGDLTVEKLGRIEKSCIGDLCIVFDTMLGNLYNLVKQVYQSVEEISAGAEELNAASDQTAQGAQQVSTSVSQLAAGSQQIAQNISQLATGCQQTAKKVAQLATGSQNQAKSINQSLENINDINKAVQKIFTGAENTVKISKSTEDMAKSGDLQADKAIKKINQLEITSTETSKTINELGELSSNIEVIVDLIKNIAGQTNLLALNAAIEAARAGEHGKGFAVVAEEVKKLAGQSAEATDKITGMIKEIQNKTNLAVTSMDYGIKEVKESVVIVDEVGHSLEEILQAAQNTSKHIQEISAEVESLSKNSDTVAKMMENISSITQQATSDVEEVSSISEETSASIEEVSSIVEESSASTEEISSIVEEQTASLEEINASSQSLTKIAENLQKQVAVFKI